MNSPDRPTIPARLLIARHHWRQMRNHLAAQAPLEACGLLAGCLQRGELRSTAVFPVANSLASPVRYRMEPTAQLAALNAIDDGGWQLAAIYHSHPLGPDFPSETDIREASYPDAVYLIWSGRSGAWRCRGFSIQPGQVQRVRLLVQG